MKNPKKKNFKLNFSAFLRSLGRYFTALFLPPWVFVWLAWVVLSVLVFFVRTTTTTLLVRFSSLFWQEKPPSIFELWIQLTLMLFVNYTFSHFLIIKHPRLRYFLIFVSSILLFLFTISLTPFILARLGEI